jgi:hypothetical protein
MNGNGNLGRMQDAEKLWDILCDCIMLRNITFAGVCVSAAFEELWDSVLLKTWSSSDCQQSTRSVHKFLCNGALGY